MKKFNKTQRQILNRKTVLFVVIIISFILMLLRNFSFDFTSKIIVQTDVNLFDDSHVFKRVLGTSLFLLLAIHYLMRV